MTARLRALTSAVLLLGMLVLCIPASFHTALWAGGDGDDGPMGGGEDLPDDPLARAVERASRSCLTCHKGIEDIHPGYPLGCVDCHGGDAQATEKDSAHVMARRTWPNDETVLSPRFDLAYQRFRNPSNLRVAMEACGACHDEEVTSILRSMHGTTAGHLNDGLYENGVLRKRGARFAIFGVRDDRSRDERPEHSLAKLEPIGGFRGGKANQISTHYRDVPRKACMRCHLWGVGRAVRGRLGMDGDYRSEGCAACHVTYADDGLSRSSDRSIDRFEPGHPMKHEFTSAIPTDTCTRCHYGDASIGMHFRGLAQLVPGQPAGPQVPGTTDYRMNGAFYVKDPVATPPDIHHEKGLHCIDCHTLTETMGDGAIYGSMEHALDIRCQDCHGEFDTAAKLRTERKGTRLRHLRRENGKVILRSKVTGKDHPVTQLVDILDPSSASYNPRAAAAMTPNHAKMECHACHTSWNVNFFGFHFDRNATFTQLDQLSGKRTPGRVTTLEKVFSTFKQFTLGFSSDGRIAPYLVGFSTMCTAVDDEGRMVLDQAFPRTAEGLSGLTMIHHHVHTVRSRPRSCVECHRSPTTWGTGSPHYTLARRLIVGGSRNGLEIWAIDRKKPGDSVRVGSLKLPQIRDIALLTDPVNGYAYMAIVATAEGLAMVDLRNREAPKLVGRLPSTDARGLHIAGRLLLLADGRGGLRVYEFDKRGRPKPLGRVATDDARAVRVDGFEAFVADGRGGLKIVSLRDPANPQVIGEAHLGANQAAADEASGLVVFFQYSRSQGSDGKGGDKPRSPARRLCFVANGRLGLGAVDVTEPSKPRRIRARAYGQLGGRQGNNVREVRAVTSGSLFDLGSEDGGIATQENDYVYVAVGRKNDEGNEQDGRLVVLRVSDPERPQTISGDARLPRWSEDIQTAHIYNPPFLRHYVLVAGAQGGDLIEVSRSAQPEGSGRLETEIRDGASQQQRQDAWWSTVAVEEFPLDRMIDEDGKALKDISHEGARYVNRAELIKLLGVELPAAPARGSRGGSRRRGR